MTDHLELYFDLSLALRLAEHADGCDEHARSISEDETATTCPGGLVWVKDWGIYLMCTGSPAIPGDDGSPNLVAYAHGWAPGDEHPNAADTPLGGDDFAEHLHLNEPYGPRGMPLLKLLRRAAAQHYGYLLLMVTADTVSVRVARQLP